MDMNIFITCKGHEGWGGRECLLFLFSFGFVYSPSAACHEIDYIFLITGNVLLR